MKTTQKDVFLNSEGNSWFDRNKSADGRIKTNPGEDPVLNFIQKSGLKPARILEIGASNGWRLSVLKQRLKDTSCSGIDPSEKAVASAPRNIEMHQGTADSLPFGPNSCDMVIFGFCLYLCDRADLFKIAAEADRVLVEDGHIIIYDFHPDMPYRNAYTHVNGIYSFKMNYAGMFAWNPAYSIVEEITMPHPGATADTPDNRVGITVLKKSTNTGWPDSPY